MNGKNRHLGSNRIYKHDDIGYYAVAKRQDGKLLLKRRQDVASAERHGR